MYDFIKAILIWGVSKKNFFFFVDHINLDNRVVNLQVNQTILSLSKLICMDNKEQQKAHRPRQAGTKKDKKSKKQKKNEEKNNPKVHISIYIFNLIESFIIFIIIDKLLFKGFCS